MPTSTHPQWHTDVRTFHTRTHCFLRSKAAHRWKIHEKWLAVRLKAAAPLPNKHTNTPFENGEVRHSLCYLLPLLLFWSPSSNPLSSAVISNRIQSATTFPLATPSHKLRSYSKDQGLANVGGGVQWTPHADGQNDTHTAIWGQSYIWKMIRVPEKIKCRVSD